MISTVAKTRRHNTNISQAKPTIPPFNPHHSPRPPHTSINPTSASLGPLFTSRSSVLSSCTCSFSSRGLVTMRFATLAILLTDPWRSSPGAALSPAALPCSCAAASVAGACSSVRVGSGSRSVECRRCVWCWVLPARDAVRERWVRLVSNIHSVMDGNAVAPPGALSNGTPCVNTTAPAPR